LAQPGTHPRVLHPAKSHRRLLAHCRHSSPRVEGVIQLADYFPQTAKIEVGIEKEARLPMQPGFFVAQQQLVCNETVTA
jgi:hypothetical protein